MKERATSGPTDVPTAPAPDTETAADTHTGTMPRTDAGTDTATQATTDAGTGTAPQATTALGAPAPADSGGPVGDDAVRAAKRTMRRELLAARSRLSKSRLRGTAGPLARQALSLPELAHARTVAGYVSMGTEPDTRQLLTALRDRGVRVLLPVLLPDKDLDWALFEGPERLHRVARPGMSVLSEPEGPRLGPETVVTADVVLLPGLAVDHGGMRLGRGGGSYDRALARLAEAGVQPALVTLLHDGEVVPRVPAERHDQPVGAAVTPSAVWRFTPPHGHRATAPPRHRA